MAPTTSRRPSFLRVVAKRMLVYIVLAAVVWCLVVYFLQRLVIYPRPSLTAAQKHTPLLPANASELDVRTPAGRVQGWFLEGNGVSDGNPGPVVIYAHGNGELIDDWLHGMAGYTSRGVSVLLAEYPGYGRSAGTPTEESIVDAFVKFYDEVAARPDVDPARIVFHGRSLGGGVVAQLARRRAPAAMILQSTFTSVSAVALRFGAPPFLIRDPYPVLPVVKAFDEPLLIIGGSRDRLLPLRYSRRLHRADPRSELLVFDIGHNDPPPEPAYWNDVASFLEKAHIIP